MLRSLVGSEMCIRDRLDTTFDPDMPVSDTNRIYLPSTIDLDRNDGPLVGTPNDTFTAFGTAAGLNAARTLDFADRSALVNAGSFQTAIGSVEENTGSLP